MKKIRKVLISFPVKHQESWIKVGGKLGINQKWVIQMNKVKPEHN